MSIIQRAVRHMGGAPDLTPMVGKFGGELHCQGRFFSEWHVSRYLKEICASDVIKGVDHEWPNVSLKQKELQEFRLGDQR